MMIHRVSFIVLLLAIDNFASVIKFTNVYCESLNESLIEVKQCRLRAVKRSIIKLNLKLKLNHPVEKIVLQAAMLKRANGYKPFLMDFNLDICEYFKRKNHPFLNMIFKNTQRHTNFNHTCPFKDEIVIKDFHLQPEILKNLPWPTGDFAAKEKWIFNGKKALLLDFYFENIEDLTQT